MEPTTASLRTAALALLGSGFEIRASAGSVSVRDTSGGSLRLYPGDASDLPSALVEELYWANFYAHSSIGDGSTFQAALVERVELPRHVVDLGCGDGRDTFAFARAGRTVVGVDRSDVAIARAGDHATRYGVAGVRFVACDAGDGDRLTAVLRGALTEDPALFYARFFLHSVPADVQHTLLSTVAVLARPGDWFAAEFRTLADQARPKVYGRHYRRYQDGSEFGRRLSAEYGFDVVDEVESAGLTPFGDEDPVVYRVLARR